MNKESNPFSVLRNSKTRRVAKDKKEKSLAPITVETRKMKKSKEIEKN